MAVTWGAESNHLRVGIDVSQSPSSVSKDTSSVTLTFTFYAQTVAWGFNEAQRITLSGGYLSDSWTYSIYSATGQTVTKNLGSRSLTVPTSYAGTVTRSVTAAITETYNGAAPTHTRSATVAQRPPQLPEAPPSASVARVDDGQQTVSWTTDYTTTAGGYPWASVEVERWDLKGGAWISRATGISPSTTSYSDTTTAADNRYEYRVRSRNSSGVSAWTYSGFVATTPAAPTDLTASKDGADVLLAWANLAAYANEVEVWHKAGTAAWDASPLATLAGAATSWPHPSPSTATTHTYRVRAVADGTPSAYSNEVTIQLLAAPDAPDQLSPSLGVGVAAGAAIPASWRHRAVDGTAQTAYEIRWRELGTSTWTTASGTTSSSHSIPALTSGKVYEWQVRTRGDHVDFSPWSALATFAVSQRPTVSITFPGASYSESRLTATWSYSDPEGTAQSAYVLTLRTSSGDVLYTYTGTSGTSHAIDYDLANGGAYRVGVKVRDGAGVWSTEAEVAFTVTYAAPPTPTVSLTWDDDAGRVLVEILNPDPGTDPAPVEHRIERSIAGGAWATVATVATASALTVPDPIPALGVANAYRVYTTSAIGTSSLATGSITPATRWAFVSSGPGFGTVAKATGNASVGVGLEVESELHYFEGRDGLPVEYVGEARSHELSFSGLLDLDDERSTEAAFVAVVRARRTTNPACYRDPRGRRVFVALRKLAIADGTTDDVRVSLDMQEVYHRE